MVARGYCMENTVLGSQKFISSLLSLTLSVKVLISYAPEAQYQGVFFLDSAREAQFIWWISGWNVRMTNSQSYATHLGEEIWVQAT